MVKKRFSRDRLKAAREHEARQAGAAQERPAVLSALIEKSSEDETDTEFFDLGEPDSASDMDMDEDLEDGQMLSVTVTESETGSRLDVLLSARHPEFSRSQLARLAKEGAILADGKPLKPSAVVSAGQKIIFPPPQAPLTDLKPDPEVTLDVIYEDEHILVLNKPWGLVVHPAPGHQGPTLAGGLLARNQKLAGVGENFRPGLVHRLDKDTSGLLVTAKTEPALRGLAESFSRRETVKRYLAFVRGLPKKRRGIVDSPIGRHATQRHKMAAGAAGGRPAKTIYRVVRHFPYASISLVMLTLVTGRTHQARVHLQSLGTPVLGDQVYSRGGGELLRGHPQLAPYLRRQLLHARRLSIKHPANGDLMTFRAPWPDDFIGLWRQLMDMEK